MMFKSFLAVLIIFLGSSQLATAQSGNSVSGRIDISANVVQFIELVTVNNIRLRNFQREQTEAYISSINSVDAGHMIAIGNPNADIQIDYATERVLTQPNGTGVLRFFYELAVNTEDNQSTSEILINPTQAFKLNREGRLFIWIGGRVDIQNAQPGAYEGEFTIEIEYI